MLIEISKFQKARAKSEVQLQWFNLLLALQCTLIIFIKRIIFQNLVIRTERKRWLA